MKRVNQLTSDLTWKAFCCQNFLYISLIFCRFLILFPVIMPNGNLFLGQHILKGKFETYILQWLDLALWCWFKTKLSYFGTVSSLSCISHLEMKILFKFFASSKNEIKYAWMSSVYALKWSMCWKSFCLRPFKKGNVRIQCYALEINASLH